MHYQRICQRLTTQGKRHYLLDKTEHNITLSKIITQYLRYIDDLYQIVEEHIELATIDKQQLKRIRLKFTKNINKSMELK